MTSTEVSCHICNGQLDHFEEFGVFRQIASDCQPYQRGGCLAICQACGTVQRPVTPDWQRTAQEIYDDYQLFSQGLEQLEEFIFHSESGGKSSRSFKMLSWLDSVFKLPENGSLLEIGCGNGGFLASFSSYRPQWTLTGLDVTENGKKLIEKIPNAFYVKGSLESLDSTSKYNLVVLSHTLEHIPNPLSFLKEVLEKLSDNGVIFVQGPDLNSAPFDILVADHCSFFTSQTLTYLLQESGFFPLNVSTNTLPKEMSVLGQKRAERVHERPIIKIDFSSAKKAIINNINFLLSLRNQALKLREGFLDIGIFGSSISSSWLFGELSVVKFFVDENPKRIGSTHLGSPILSPDNLSNRDIVLMPLRHDIAKSIADRLHADLGLDKVFVLPPYYISSQI
jgi:2-polyprenyl-3-methyl-5-hydroxy-6-metoxy-1,4-benzoquinol methylase